MWWWCVGVLCSGDVWGVYMLCGVCVGGVVCGSVWRVLCGGVVWGVCVGGVAVVENEDDKRRRRIITQFK